jgi:pimeloyl-ACP methyl ester carboxylesterase
MSIERLIHWVRALLDALDQTDVVLVGSFLGGMLARLFAAAEPQYVPAIILINGGTIPRIPALLQPLAGLPVIGEFTFRMFGRIQPLNRLIYVKDALSEDLNSAWHANASGFAQLMRAALFTAVPEKQTPLVPTLLLWGMNDPVMTPAHAARLQAEIPGAQFSPIADCGHMPQLEATDALLFQVTAFLDRLTRPVTPVLPGVGMLHTT